MEISKHIREYFNKNNLHHAYLIEGAHEEILPEVLEFCEDLDIKTSGNPDFCLINLDSFKIDEAFDLRTMSSDKSFTSGKKIFVICANSFTLDAQNVLLKMFEEPIENTHFFVIVPDTNALLRTLVSRFYLIKPKSNHTEFSDAEGFIKMPLQKRIDFLKELLPKKDEENEEDISTESNNAKALKFLNKLELFLQSKFVKNFSDFTLPGIPGGTYTVQNSLQICFEHFFKVREFLRMPGSSARTLMESVAIVVPKF